MAFSVYVISSFITYLGNFVIPFPLGITIKEKGIFAHLFFCQLQKNDKVKLTNLNRESVYYKALHKK